MQTDTAHATQAPPENGGPSRTARLRQRTVCWDKELQAVWGLQAGERQPAVSPLSSPTTKLRGTNRAGQKRGERKIPALWPSRRKKLPLLSSFQPLADRTEGGREPSPALALLTARSAESGGQMGERGSVMNERGGVREKKARKKRRTGGWNVRDMSDMYKPRIE
ncbi:hypothetical protein MHYP_G00359580 [Metynnis hypsauchen]